MSRVPETACLATGVLRDSDEEGDGAAVGSRDEAPPVRAEIRGTAGRVLAAGAFAVGRAAECEVQTFGDDTVPLLQCLVFSLPGGIVIADLWSEEGTRMTWLHRSGEGGAPGTDASRGVPLVLAHGDRAIFRVGSRTTVSIGPSAKKMEKRERRAARKDRHRDADEQLWEARVAECEAARAKEESDSKRRRLEKGSGLSDASTMLVSPLTDYRSTSATRSPSLHPCHRPAECSAALHDGYSIDAVEMDKILQDPASYWETEDLSVLANS